MRVLLKMTLDCDADTAWRAIRSPSVLAQVSRPLLAFESLEPGGFPEVWDAGEHPVLARAGGVVPVGVQVIGVSFPEFVGGVPSRASGNGVASRNGGGGLRAMRDTGRALSGPLTVITRWEHTLTVTPTADGRTLYRDRLVFEAGAVTLLLWPVYWAFWQWRGIRMRRFAPTWERSSASD